MEPTSTGRTRRGAIMIFVSGLLIGGMLAAFNVATAQTSAPDAQTSEKAEGKGKGKGWRFGLRSAIHGEFVVEDEGAFKNMVWQKGEVTEVSATRLTVRSKDGLTRTYAIDENTKVRSDKDGIAGITKGEQVKVVAEVTGSANRAVMVADDTPGKGRKARMRERMKERMKERMAERLAREGASA